MKGEESLQSEEVETFCLRRDKNYLKRVTLLRSILVEVIVHGWWNLSRCGKKCFLGWNIVGVVRGLKARSKVVVCVLSVWKVSIWV